MKEKNRNEVMAGLVILTGIVLFTTVFILAGNFRQFFGDKRKIQVSFRSARGLVENNPIQVNGVELGLVKSISLVRIYDEATETWNPRVLVVGEIPADIFIPDNSEANIDVSLTGVTVLKIDRGDSSRKQPENVALVGSDALNITELATKAGNIAQSIDQFIKSINSDAVIGNVKAVLVNTRRATEKLARMSGKLEEILTTNRSAWNDLVENFRSISDRADQFLAKNSDNLTATISHLPETTKNLKKLSRDTSRLVAKNEENITEAISDIRKTSQNLKETSRKVKWQPWVIFHKPEKGDANSQNLYTAARDLEISATEMRDSLVTMKVLSQYSGTKVSQRDYDRLIQEMDQSIKTLKKLSARVEKEL